MSQKNGCEIDAIENSTAKIIFSEPEIKRKIDQMVKQRKDATKPLFEHLKSRLVRISDPHCCGELKIALS